MTGITTHPLAWVGAGVGLLLLFALLELPLMWLAARFGTPQWGYRHRGPRAPA